MKTLSAIGTEKEIAALENARNAGVLKDDEQFWGKVAECEKAIRARADAKKKAADLKAKPADPKKDDKK